MEKVYEILIIGGGPAGLTAAIYSTRANLSTFSIAGVEAGGQLLLTTDVEDFPGFSEGIQGPELVSQMRKQAERLGVGFINEDVSRVDFKKRPFELYANDKKFLTKSVVVATGASAIWLDLTSEQKLIGRGVSSCAVCDGPFFKGKKVAVVGGGDTAMREAIFLSKVASHVSVIHRRDKLRAFPALQDQAFSKPNIKFIWNSVVEEVLGENKVEGIRVRDVKQDKTENHQIDGLFVAIGHKPNTEFLKGQIELDEKGYIVVRDGTKTSVPGVFAAGDVHDWRYQQAVTAAGAGCMAAMDAEEFLEEEKLKENVSSKA